MISVEKLEGKLNNGKLNSMYILFGEELFLLESSLNKIKKIFGEKIKGINYIVIDDTNLAELISDMETPAFRLSKKINNS